MTKWVVLGLIGFSLLPIWRGAGHPRTDGVNFWRLAYDSTQTLKESKFGYKHIPYEDAVKFAHEAWVEAGRPAE